jgi:hypothetical protein
LLGKISRYNRSTRAGRRAAANICIYPQKGRITLNEGKLKKQERAGEDNDHDDAGPAADVTAVE